MRLPFYFCSKNKMIVTFLVDKILKYFAHFFYFKVSQSYHFFGSKMKKMHRAKPCKKKERNDKENSCVYSRSFALCDECLGEGCRETGVDLP